MAPKAHAVIYLSSNALRKDRYDLQRLGYGASSLLKVAVGLSTFNLGITVYIHPSCLKLTEVQQLLQTKEGKEFDIVVREDDSDFEPILRSKNHVICLLWHGVLDLRIQALCRFNGTHVVLGEAGWFDRDNSIFLDNLGVAFLSSLTFFDTYPKVTAQMLKSLRELRKRMVGVRMPEVSGHILLILNSSDVTHGFFNERYRRIENIVYDMQLRFPNDTVIVKMHPRDVADFTQGLPDNFKIAGEGSVFDWSRRCKMAIGFNSKAIFAPLFFDKPVYSLAAGLENYFFESHCVRSATSILEINPSARMYHPERRAVKAFLYEVLFQRHFIFDEWPYRMSVMNNRVISRLAAIHGGA